jgi:hypothetical protein
MGGPGEGTCESCGDTGVELVRVRRLYVTPESWDQAGRVDIADDEWWCYVCRTHYPHHELDDEGSPIEHELGWPLTEGGPAEGT